MEAESRSILQFLSCLGLEPEKEYKKGWLFRAPYNIGAKPSLWVERYGNAWQDLATGMHGDLSDLGVACYGVTDISMAIKGFRFRGRLPYNPTKAAAPYMESCINREIRDLEISEIDEARLLDFLRERCIDIDIAKAYCAQARFFFRKKRYACICAENRSGGYEMLNGWFHCLFSPMDITLIRDWEAKRVCHVFESTLDFLSFLTLHLLDDYQKLVDDSDFVVLNTPRNAGKAALELLGYRKVLLCLPNTFDGEMSARSLLGVLDNCEIISTECRGCRDVNEYLMALNNKK